MYWITFGGTHRLLYISAARHELLKKGLKFNPKFPGDGSKRYPVNDKHSHQLGTAPRAVSDADCL